MRIKVGNYARHFKKVNNNDTSYCYKVTAMGYFTQKLRKN